MKTTEFIIRGFEYPILVHHHDDWSGSVVVEWIDNKHRTNHHVELPAAILLHLSINQTKDWVLAELEDAIANLKGDSRG